jgi:hypothetical protein
VPLTAVVSACATAAIGVEPLSGAAKSDEPAAVRR